MMLLSGTWSLISLTDEADAGCLKSSLPVSPATMCILCEQKERRPDENVMKADRQTD